MMPPFCWRLPLTAAIVPTTLAARCNKIVTLFSSVLSGSKMMNTTTNSSVFDAFDDHKEHDENDIAGESSHILSSSSKAVDLLVIGIILLAIVIVIDFTIRTYFFCKIRKQKRVIAPCPVDMMAAAIANGGANNDHQISHVVQTIDEESVTAENLAVVH